MNQAPSKPSGKRRRRWLQFSVRSLFVLMVVVGAVCAWYMRPKQRELELAGGKMFERWQYRMLSIPDSDQPIEVRHGRWELIDRNSGRRMKGYYDREWRQKWWTVYHDNGRKAIQGCFRRGAPTGTWKTWFADGKRESECEFTTRSRPALYADGKPQKPLPMPLFPGSRLAPKSVRSGPSRVWWPNGNLRLEGEYRDDRRHGHWTLYDRSGNKTAAGPYRNGQRHGTWTFWDGQGKPPREVAYAYGRRLSNVDELLAVSARRLDEDDLSARLAAARQLEALGPFALPVLANALSHHEPDVRVLALRAICLLGPDARSALPKIEELDNEREPSTVRWNAKLAICSIDESRRGAIVRAFLARATSAVDEERRTIVRLLARLDESILPFLGLALDDRDVEIRLAVIDVLAELAKRRPTLFNDIFGLGLHLLDKARKDPDERVQERVQRLQKQLWDTPIGGGIPVVG